MGKTSAVQLPLLLKQTAAVSNTNYTSALKVHGREVSFGDTPSIFRNKDPNSPLSIDFSISSKRLHSIFSQKIPDELHEYIVDFYGFADYMSKRKSNLNVDTDKIGAPIRKYLRHRQNTKGISYDEIIDAYMVLKETISLPETRDLDLPIFRGVGHHFSDRQYRGRYYGATIKPLSITRTDLERSFRLSAQLAAIQERDISVSFEIGLAHSRRQKTLDILRFRIYQAEKSSSKTIIDIRFEQGQISEISSDLIPHSDISAYTKTIQENFVTSSDIFSFVKWDVSSLRYIFPDMVRNICLSATEELRNLFDGDAIRHIGPLRAHPKRFYFLDTAQQGSAEGDSLVEALRENKTLRKQVNDWLKVFEVNIDVKQFEEIIHRLAVKSGGNSFDLDITDVGFGISQILPILAEGYLSPPGTTIIVEQPEIHLHPKMQGDLADLFIAMSGSEKSRNTNNNTQRTYFLVETHSEYLLNRLRRRIAEQKVSHEDVAIIVAEKIEDGSTALRSVAISPDGNFEWPKGFLDANLADAIAFAQATAETSNR